ncbi:MAG TPA: hypothetical protein VEI52_04685 [Terriglobales bacterium]|nr:hypothetical protein [Terriglobales bacterium]
MRSKPPEHLDRAPYDRSLGTHALLREEPYEEDDDEEDEDNGREKDKDVEDDEEDGGYSVCSPQARPLSVAAGASFRAMLGATPHAGRFAAGQAALGEMQGEFGRDHRCCRWFMGENE